MEPLSLRNQPSMLFILSYQQKKITCFLLLTFLCEAVSAQNTFDFKKFNLYDLNSLSVGSDTGRVNDDSPNRIFVPGRKFTYGYSMKKNGRSYRFAAAIRIARLLSVARH